MAVPAEEFIDVQYRWNLHQEGKLGLMAGKQELIRLGAFDDVDLAMMVHTSSSSAESGKFALGGPAMAMSSNLCASSANQLMLGVHRIRVSMPCKPPWWR